MSLLLTPTLITAALIGTAFALIIWALMIILRHQFSSRERVSRRLQQLHPSRTGQSGPRRSKSGTGTDWRQSIIQLPLLDDRQRREVQRKLVSAGFRGRDALLGLMLCVVGSALLGALLTTLWTWPLTSRLHWIIEPAVAIIGLWIGGIIPRIVLDQMAIKRQRMIQKALPDALDLMIICVNAGLGLNATIQRLARDLRHISPALADEFSVTAADAQLRGATTEALRQMADRVDLPAIANLVSTLAMAQRYGTPIAQALRVLAESERSTHLLRLEEKAGKLSTKITLPMMIFIMPTVLIVAAGPAVLSLMEGFR